MGKKKLCDLDLYCKNLKIKGISYADAQVKETWEKVAIRQRFEKLSMIKARHKAGQLKPFDRFRVRGETEAHYLIIELLKIGIEANIIQDNGTWLNILVIY